MSQTGTHSEHSWTSNEGPDKRVQSSLRSSSDGPAKVKTFGTTRLKYSLGWGGWRRRNACLRDDAILRRPSVALTDYEITDTRTSAMSSLLLLFAVLEGMCGFVLPICSAFSKPMHSLKRYYYEDFLLFQYCLSIVALCYLQALIFYYDQKENLRYKYCYKVDRQNIDTESGTSGQSHGEQSATPNKAMPTISASYLYEGTGTPRSPDKAFHLKEVVDSSSAKGPTTPASILNSASTSDNGNRYPQGSTATTKVTFTLSPTVTTSNNRIENLKWVDSGPSSGNTNIFTFKDVDPNMDENVVHREQAGLRHELPLTTTEAVHVRETSIDRDPVGSSSKESVESPREFLENTNCTVSRRKCIRPLKFLFGDRPGGTRQTDWHFSRDSEGVNLYLRLGAVGFGFGVMIFDGFKMAEPWEVAMNDASSCYSQLWVPIHFLHFVYVFWQTYFLFKHHQVVFNVQKFVLRFLLCHLAVANLCQWLKTIVDEISVERHYETELTENHTAKPTITMLCDTIKELLEKTPNDTLSHYTMDSKEHGKLNVISICENNLTEHPTNELFVKCRSTAQHLAPFLFPCAIEYSLIAGAIFYKMFQKIGHIKKESERRETVRLANTLAGRFAECHRSHKGLFIGLLSFMATLVTMCLFFIFFVKREKRTTAITLYQCTELVLLAMSTITCIVTTFRLRVLRLSALSEEGAFDDNLLLVGLIGMIFYDLFLLVPALEAFPSGQIAARLFAAKALLEIVQSVVQVFFIFEASRRCAGTVAHVRDKPGRTLITFLLILNLAMWFVNTFEVKRADNNSIHIDYYTEMAWKIITHIALPMIVFFRFHSTVCLSDIWANAYRFRTS